MQSEHLFSMSVFCFISALCVLHPPASPDASASPSAPSAPPPTANVANCCPLLPQIITPQHQVQKKTCAAETWCHFIPSSNDHMFMPAHQHDCTYCVYCHASRGIINPRRVCCPLIIPSLIP